jgi:hypothetical protein
MRLECGKDRRICESLPNNKNYKRQKMNDYEKHHGSLMSMDEYTDVLTEFHGPESKQMSRKRLQLKEEFEETRRKFEELANLAEKGKLETLKTIFEDASKEGHPINLSHPMFGSIVRLPLVAAIGTWQPECVEYLLSQGADPAQRNTIGRQSAYEASVYTQQPELAERFAPYEPPKPVAPTHKSDTSNAPAPQPPKKKTHGSELTGDEYGMLVREYDDNWSDKYKSEAAKKLIGEFEERRELMSSIKRAAEGGNLDKLKSIFDKEAAKGQPVNLNDQSFSRSDMLPLAAAITSGNKDCVDFLLAKGANPNQYDGQGRPAWHAAVLSERYSIAKDLIANHGADINIKNKDNGNTVLHIAAREGRIKDVEFLAANGADQTIQNNDGKIAFQMGGTNRVQLHAALKCRVEPLDPYALRARQMLQP